MSTCVDPYGRWLDDRAAGSYLAAAEAGCPAGITSAGRTYAEQAELRALYEAGKGAYAMRPGTSAHERGLAVDLPVGPRAWMLAHPDYGWRRTNPREAWHFEYFVVLDVAPRPAAQAPAQALAGPVIVTPPTPDWEAFDDMRWLVIALYGIYLGRVPSDPEVNSWLVPAAEHAWTPGQLADTFKGAKAERGTVTQAYLAFLDRLPESDEVIRGWTDGDTIAQVWDGVANSPEAKARR